jgi:hypothetical protein
MRTHTEPVADAPQTFEEATKGAQHVVLANVVSVIQGPDFIAPIEGTRDVHRVPSQRILIHVVKVYKGQVQADQTLTLYQVNTGVTTARPYANGPLEPVLMIDENDPPYQIGQRYLLALMEVPIPQEIKKVQPEPWPEGMVMVNSLVGRLLVKADGTLTSVVADTTGKSIPGRMLGATLQQVEALITPPIVPSVTTRR